MRVSLLPSVLAVIFIFQRPVRSYNYPKLCCFHGATAEEKKQAAAIMNTSAGVVVDAETEAAEADVCCANCGIAGVDNVKLE